MLLKILVLAIAAMGAASAQSDRRNCESSCGNLNITYPFGSGEGCYYSPYFLVTCDRSSGGEPVLFFGENTTNIVISNMSTSKSEVEIMMFVGRDCYNSSGSVGLDEPTLTLTDFRISAKNKFVAIGCDTYAYFEGRRGGDQVDGTGCMSKCGRDSRLTDESCSGVGCCEVAVPGGLQNFEMTIFSVYNHTNITDFNPCSYAFFVEQEQYNFSTTNLLDFENVSKMPMLLDWAIGNQTCNQAKDKDGFLCKENSKCDQDYGGPGYRCNCLEGYEGNPYIADDCKNINECERQIHDCEDKHICVDTPGNYTCTCKDGYSGDGRKNGTRCTANQSTVIKIALGISTSVIFLFVCVTWLYLVLKKRKLITLREKFFKQNGGIMLQQRISGDGSSQNQAKVFSI